MIIDPNMVIDPHRHLGGSIPTRCVWEIIKKRGYNYLASSLADVEQAMTFSDNEPRDFHRFLDKFKILDEIEWDEELIDISIKSICDDLESEGIDFCWLDFSINKYMGLKWHKSEAIEYIHECFEAHRPGKVGLILSLKYESLRRNQLQYSELIDNDNIVDRLMGIDLVGDEEYFSYDFYKPIFEQWKKAGKMVRAHVGESKGFDNIRNAIKMGATNIAHGIKCYDAGNDLIQMAIDNEITFDTAITSNYLTGVWSNPYYHPVIYMIENSLKLTIGSDDPVVCSTTLEKEFDIFRSLIYNNVGRDIADVIITSVIQTAIDNTSRHVQSSTMSLGGSSSSPDSTDSSTCTGSPGSSTKTS